MEAVEDKRERLFEEMDRQAELPAPLRAVRSKDVMCNVYKNGSMKLRGRVQFRDRDEGVRQASKDVG